MTGAPDATGASRYPPTSERTVWTRNFTVFWLGNAQSTFGSAMSGTALAFLVLQLTGSSSATGLTLALAMLPSLLGPFTGTLVDRLPWRLPLVAGDMLRGALLIVVWWLYSHQLLQVEVVYGLSLLNGLIGIFHQPATQALLPSLVTPSQLTRANGLVGVSSQVASLLGLVLGGVVIGHYGLSVVLLADAASFLLMGLLYLVINVPSRTADRAPQTFWADMQEGLATMRGSRVLQLVPALGFLIMAAFAPLNMLMPKYMETLGYGAQGYGLFMAFLSGGMILGSTLTSMIGTRFQPAQGVTYGFFVAALAQMALSLSGALLLMLPLALVTGLGLSFANIGLMVLIQTLTPPAQMGRVFGVLGSAATLGMPLTLLALSGVADNLQPHLVFVSSGLAVAITAVIWAFRVRSPHP